MAGQGDWKLVLIEDLHATYALPGLLDAPGERAYPALRALEPSYGLRWLLEADAPQLAQIEAELALLRDKPGSAGYRAWVEGVLALAPLRRGRPEDGFRWPRNAADWSVYRRARPLIDREGAAPPCVPRAGPAILASGRADRHGRAVTRGLRRSSSAHGRCSRYRKFFFQS